MLSVEEKLLLRYEQCLDDEESDTFDLRPLLLSSAVMAAGEDDDGDEGGDDDADEDDDSDDEDQEDEDDEDEDEDEDDKSKSKSKGRRRGDPRLVRANRQAANQRIKAREERKKREAAEKKLKDLENKGKPEADKLKEDFQAMKQQLEEAGRELAKYKRKETIKSLADEYEIVDASLLRVVLEDNDIELDEDGEWPEDIDKKLKRLIKKHPGLVARSNGKKGDEGDDDEDEGPPRVKTAGRGNKKAKGDKRQALVKTYPALAGRIR